MVKTHRHQSSSSTYSTGDIKPDTRSKDQWTKDFSGAQGKTLIIALHNLIVPLVQNTVSHASDLCQFSESLEAENLLVALKKYVATIVGRQTEMENVTEGPTARTISLKDLEVSEATKAPDTKREVESEILQEMTKLERTNNMDQGLSEIDIENPLRDPFFSLENLLGELQERVFNRLPIRLFFFEKLGNPEVLKISLLNRAELYSYLSKKFTIIRANTSIGPSKLYDELNSLTKYAILSHTWARSISGEVSYNGWRNGSLDLTQPGFKKLVQFCRAALENHGLSLGWMDTVCIDKSSSSELDESIRSMFKWYQNSSICITYLAETESFSDMVKDSWFTRGWTLQELLAPTFIKFYNRAWNQLTTSKNDKWDNSIQAQIELATSITKTELLTIHLAGVSFSRKMQWAARRRVTRTEDVAYSLMGLFDISMSIAYGEGGQRAFVRLIKEILSTSKYRTLDIFNWGGEYASDLSSLLPSSPKAYLERDERLDISPILMEPLTLTHMGLRVPVLILPTKVTESSIITRYTPKGDFFASAYPSHAEGFTIPFRHLRQNLNLTCNVLDCEAFGPRLNRREDRHAFAVLNCTGDERNLKIPKICFAILIRYPTDDVTLAPLTFSNKIPSLYPIVFPLQRNTDGLESSGLKYAVERSELERHGMQCLSMYI
ncbi:hypothetical protein BDN70DRAFT_843490 [Pholiota conissans]|uniref:Heterokaryon incompatibility domain-containing protein n=1 Tax=Pholiota conissans TaxID=109636 RepID=A0A9P6CVB5_9AGAR|nr:hypothetical protein BDN70DRAFT_843490 [Pholiota conissans]